MRLGVLLPLAACAALAGCGPSSPPPADRACSTAPIATEQGERWGELKVCRRSMGAERATLRAEVVVTARRSLRLGIRVNAAVESDTYEEMGRSREARVTVRAGQRLRRAWTLTVRRDGPGTGPGPWGGYAAVGFYDLGRVNQDLDVATSFADATTDPVLLRRSAS